MPLLCIGVLLRYCIVKHVKNMFLQVILKNSVAGTFKSQSQKACCKLTKTFRMETFDIQSVKDKIALDPAILLKMNILMYGSRVSPQIHEHLFLPNILYGLLLQVVSRFINQTNVEWCSTKKNFFKKTVLHQIYPPNSSCYFDKKRTKVLFNCVYQFIDQLFYKVPPGDRF